MSSHGYSTTASAPALSGLLPRSERGGGLSHCLPYESATTPVGSLDRAELQVQLGQPPHLPGGLVGVAACVGWAVRTLRNRDVGHPVEYPVEGNASLGPGEWRSSITVDPAGIDTSPIEVDVRAMRKWDFTGLSIRSASSMKAGMRSRSPRSNVWMSGRSAITRIAKLSNLVVVSCPAANRNVASRTTSMISGVDPSGYFAPASSVSTYSRGSRRRSAI